MGVSLRDRATQAVDIVARSYFVGSKDRDAVDAEIPPGKGQKQQQAGDGDNAGLQAEVPAPGELRQLPAPGVAQFDEPGLKDGD